MARTQSGATSTPTPKRAVPAGGLREARQLALVSAPGLVPLLAGRLAPLRVVAWERLPAH